MQDILHNISSATSRNGGSFHRVSRGVASTGEPLRKQPREYADTTLQANMATVKVIETIQADQAMHVRRRARDLSEMSLSEEYDRQYVWSIGDGMLLRSEEVIDMVMKNAHSLDLMRQQLPISTAQRIAERFSFWSENTPEESVPRARLGALVSPAEAVAMIRAVNQLLVGVFAKGVSDITRNTKYPDVFHSVSLLSSRRLREEQGFGETHHGGFEYALSATVKASLTSDLDVLIDNRLELLSLPVERERTDYVDGVVVDSVDDTSALVVQGRVVQVTGQIFTAVKRNEPVEMSLRVAGLAYMIVEQLRQAANQAIAK